MQKHVMRYVVTCERTEGLTKKVARAYQSVRVDVEDGVVILGNAYRQGNGYIVPSQNCIETLVLSPNHWDEIYIEKVWSRTEVICMGYENVETANTKNRE